jgi:hypothetical protein
VREPAASVISVISASHILHFIRLQIIVVY